MYAEVFARSLASMVPSIFLTLSGIFICYKKWFDANINSQILRATTDFMLPLYILFSLPRVYGDENSPEVWKLWPLIISPIILLPVLGIIGLLCSLLINVPSNLKFSVASVYSFASIGNIGILVVKGACASYGPLHDASNKDLALPYLCMMWLPFEIIMFILALPLLKAEGKSEHNEQIINVIIRYLLLPLPICAIAANILGIIPGMHWFLFEKDSVGYMLTDCALIIGNTGILFSQMNVGSNMVLDLNSKGRIDKWKIIWIAISRNIFVPCVVFFYVNLMWNYGLFYDDKVMAYTVFIGLSAPPAFMILIIMNDFGIDTKEVKSIILWIFITSIFTMTLSVFFFFIIF